MLIIFIILKIDKSLNNYNKIFKFVSYTEKYNRYSECNHFYRIYMYMENICQIVYEKVYCGYYD